MDTEHLLRELLAVIHGDGGHHAQQHGLEESARQAHERIADLRRALDTTEEDLEDADAAYQELEESCRQAHERIADLRRALDAAVKEVV